MSAGNEKKKCSCGSENCSGFLGVRPKTQHALKLQEEKKKNQESKKKKKKTANKKNVAGKKFFLNFLSLFSETTFCVNC